ncbi:DUF4145 domain-containing protein [Shewanella sp.]|uniref:DUF4145 domain-containing protein n=1 Tax=Shewanella sp. TaxID=50422 RepID=UPI0040483A57
MDEFLKESFDIKHLPQWECPTCKRGILELKGDLSIEETADTLTSHNHPEFDYAWVTYTITGTLKCNNARCCETVVVTGTGQHDEYSYYDGNGLQYEDCITSFKPIFFYPPVNIFKVSTNVPDEITQMLGKSFALFFCDDNACGNRIRATVEVMLDVMQIPNKPEKGTFLPLDTRIQKIDGISPSLKNKLIALKLLGNAGTHGAGTLLRKDNIDAYKLLAHVFDKLFPIKEDELDQLSAGIIKNKGPVR